MGLGNLGILAQVVEEAGAKAAGYAKAELQEILGSAGNPSTVNCIPVSAGCYPVVVPTGGSVNISWNTQ